MIDNKKYGNTDITYRIHGTQSPGAKLGRRDKDRKPGSSQEITVKSWWMQTDTSNRGSRRLRALIPVFEKGLTCTRLEDGIADDCYVVYSPRASGAQAAALAHLAAYRFKAVSLCGDSGINHVHPPPAFIACHGWVASRRNRSGNGYGRISRKQPRLVDARLQLSVLVE